MKIIFVLILSLFILSCEDDDKTKIFEAQNCLDNLPVDSTAAQAQACYKLVSGLSSQQAYIVKCAAKLIEGGLTDTKMTTAFKYFSDNEGAANSQAQLMTLLNLSSLAVANQAVSDCEKSQIGGNMFIATAAATGTAIGQIAGIDFNNIDPNDPNSIKNELDKIDSGITDCVANNTCDPAAQETIENAVDAVAGSYCSGDNTEDFCQDIEQAQASGNVYEAFLCAVQGLEYDGNNCVSN